MDVQIARACAPTVRCTCPTKCMVARGLNGESHSLKMNGWSRWADLPGVHKHEWENCTWRTRGQDHLASARPWFPASRSPPRTARLPAEIATAEAREER